MKLNCDDFRVAEGRTVKLAKVPTLCAPHYQTKEEYRDLLAKQIGELRHLQEKLYASDQYAVLVIFQALDAAGKDGAISHVMSGINPQGCQVFSFKHPSAQELQHDFLWRTTQCLPERGRIGIFNRSYYEEALVVRVHPEILRGENLADSLASDPELWQKRYHSIVELERHLHRNGTVVVKFYLHISAEEQRRRFLARIDDPSKNWKFSDADLVERKYFAQYLQAFEQCLSATSTDFAPWYIIPADDKENARLIVAGVIVETLRALDLKFPVTTPERRAELARLREQLIQEGA